MTLNVPALRRRRERGDGESGGLPSLAVSISAGRRGFKGFGGEGRGMPISGFLLEGALAFILQALHAGLPWPLELENDGDLLLPTKLC